MSYRSPIYPPKTIKNKLKNLSPQKPKTIKQKPETLIDQCRKIHINTKVNNEKPRNRFKLPSAKLNRDPSTSRMKSPKRINYQCNSQQSTKSLNKFYREESMDIETNKIITNFNLEDI